jgi:hypothetical protein
VDAGQSHGHVIAKPIKRVVCACGRDWLNRKVCPLRKLRGEQTDHKRYVGFYLVDMHLASGHETLNLSIREWVFKGAVYRLCERIAG